jgi:Proteins containing SET domain
MLHSALHPGFSKIHGTGIVALRDIPMGTAVWWPCPRCVVFPPDRQSHTPDAVLRWVAEYGYRRADGAWITPCSGASFFNHSCDASVLSEGLSVGIAVRDIARGEEVTSDYREFRYEDSWEFSCACRSPRCVGVVRSTHESPPPQLQSEWLAKVHHAVAAARTVSQETPVLGGDIHGVVIGGSDG